MGRSILSSVDRRPAPARRALAALASVLLVAVLAGCSGSERAERRTAASVGDAEISQALVVDLMAGQLRYAERLAAASKKAAKDAPDDATVQAQADQASAALEELTTTFGGTGAQAGTDSFGTAGAAQVLSTAIQVELLRDAAREADVAVNAAAIREARASIVDSIKADGVTSTKGFEALLDLYGELQAYQSALTEEFATTGAEREAQLQAAFAEALPEQSQYCVAIIATADEASAQAAYARVQAGEDFVAVGNEVSLDKTSLTAGNETCITGTQLFGVFTEASPPLATGTVLAPVDGQGSWIFVRVVSTTVPTFEQLRPQLEQSTPDEAATTKVQDALAKALKRADVTVDPRYGTWNAETGVVEAPEAEPSGTTSSTTSTTTAAASGSDAAGS